MSDLPVPESNRTIPIPSDRTDPGAPTSRRPLKRRVVLLIYHRGGVEVVPLAAGQPVVVGREPPSDAVIPQRVLSRQHARFTRDQADLITVEDLGSLNGVTVAGERVQRALIKPGDQIMLGTVAAAVHVLAGDDAPPLGLESHEAFLAAVDAEIMRVRFFRRPLALLIVRATDRDRALFPRWCPRVRQLLRPVDRIGFYGAGVAEILLPESELADALTLGRSIVLRVEGEPQLLCGVAVFGGDGSTSAEILVAAAREAAHEARPSTPVRRADSKPTRTVPPEAQPAAPDEDGPLIRRSPAMNRTLRIAEQAAKSAIPVLLQGETGAGKEVLARYIHESGARGAKPLVCVNCGAIPQSLVESTLFGHEKGAFSGAVALHRGVFEAADGGSVLLDEIGELPAMAQAALLRVLETRRITRVGTTREIEVDVRVIAATHRDLQAMCASGGFREDLYHRLNALELEIPPLRARREDIAPLARRFLARAAEAEDRGPMSFDPETLKVLESYAWPGNVRELRNVIDRAVVIAEGSVVTPQDLPERLRARAALPSEPPPPPALPPPPAPDSSYLSGSLRERVERLEHDSIVAALRETKGKQPETARLLDLPLRTLQYKINKYRIKSQY